ncbi:MAG: hypothetical protein ACYDCL_05900 [Myxococcales bacterium]
MLRTLALAASLAALAACAQPSAARRDETGQALREETGPHAVATGRIAAVDRRRHLVLIDRASGGMVVLRLTPSTVITKDGQPAAASQVEEGVPVRAAYRAAYGENRALVVDVSEQGAFPPAPAAPQP